MTTIEHTGRHRWCRGRTAVGGFFALALVVFAAPAAVAQGSGAADLSITTAMAGSARGMQGDQLLITLVVRNDGPAHATGVLVDEQLDGIGVVAATPSQGSCSIASRTRFSCSLETVVAGGSAQVFVKATQEAPSRGVVMSTVTAEQAELDPGDNQRRTLVVFPLTPHPLPGAPPTRPEPDLEPEVDLVVEKRSSATQIAVGARVGYTITVTNRGPQVARNVRLRDTLNAQATMVSVASTAGECARQLPMTCRLGRMATGERRTITVVVEHQRAACGQQTAVSVTATGAGRLWATDTDPSDNLDIDRLCEPPGALELDLDIRHGDRLRAGDTVRSWIEARNPYPTDVRNAELCARLPAGLVYAGSNRRVTLIRGKLCWTDVRVQHGTVGGFALDVRALPGTRGRKIIHVSLTAPDMTISRITRAIRVIGARTRPGGVTG